MKSCTSRFFTILAQCLVVFMIYGVFTASRDISVWIFSVLGISFLFAYSVAIVYPKLVNKFGERHFKLILFFQNLILSTVLFIVASMLGYVTSYISFLIEYILIALITYYINKTIYIKEINDLNEFIQNAKR
ncbi:Uncharacterised protein [[Clostridium] sordellii]|uniref:hypothetical protein n=1 Tax=Paraclostridium sordellii TaxID=1505 RepID=UPI0005E6857B|nr:hypothetical protein [Paeniclostridium sordellii]CEN88778.1 Uncharacterised protein [[Clostridium] sordellii] [Paeniclostridium sordellii]